MFLALRLQISSRIVYPFLYHLSITLGKIQLYRWSSIKLLCLVSEILISDQHSLLIYSSSCPPHPHFIGQKLSRLFWQKRIRSDIFWNQKRAMKRSYLYVLGAMCAVAEAWGTATVVYPGNAYVINFHCKSPVATWPFVFQFFTKVKMYQGQWHYLWNLSLLDYLYFQRFISTMRPFRGISHGRLVLALNFRSPWLFILCLTLVMFLSILAAYLCGVTSVPAFRNHLPLFPSLYRLTLFIARFFWRTSLMAFSSSKFCWMKRFQSDWSGGKRLEANVPSAYQPSPLTFPNCYMRPNQKDTSW